MDALTRAGLAGAGFVILVVGLTWGIAALGRYFDDQERLSQQRCIERGGKVTMYAGGFTKWACEGMTKL